MKCRTCLGNSVLNSDLKKKVGLGKTVEEIIRLFIPEMIDARLGDSVCTDCIDTVKVFVKFIERCIVVEKYFMTQQDLKKRIKLKRKLQLVEESKDQNIKSVSSNFLMKKKNYSNRNLPTVKENFRRKIVAKFSPIVTSLKATLIDKTQNPRVLDEPTYGTKPKLRTYFCKSIYIPKKKDPLEVKDQPRPIPSVNIVKVEVEELSDQPEDTRMLTNSIEKTVNVEDCNNFNFVDAVYASREKKSPDTDIVIDTSPVTTNGDSEHDLENNGENDFEPTNDNSFQRCDTEITDSESKENVQLENNTASSSNSSQENVFRCIETDFKEDAGRLSLTELKPMSTVSNVTLKNVVRTTICGLRDVDIDLAQCNRVLSMTNACKQIDKILGQLPTDEIDLTELQSCQKDTKRVIFLGKAFIHCPACRAPFSHISSVKFHFKNTHPDLDFVQLFYKPTPTLRAPCRMCPVCKKYFGPGKLLLGHLREAHKDYRPFRCEFCGTGFWKKYFYVSHVKNYKRFQNCKVRICNVCKKTISVEQFKAHMDSHRTLECKVCGKRFMFKVNLNEHLSSHQAIKQKKKGLEKELCNICGKLVAGRSGMKVHMLRHTGIRNYLCDRCSKVFKVKPALDRHIKVVHKDMKHDFECSICQTRAKDKSTLEFHMKLKHSTDYTFVCHICGAGFIQDDHYNRHMKQHLINTPKSILKYIRVSRGKRDFPCKFCYRTFKNVDLLRIHLFTAHMKNARLKCQYCDLTFKNSWSKGQHEKRHEDPKTYELTCKVCWNRFSSKEKLEVHSVKHVGSQKRKCDECGEVFPSRLFLAHHKGEMHFDQEQVDAQRQNLLWEGLRDFIL